MKPQQIAPLDVLWRPQTLISAVLAGEALALILALAPGSNPERWVYFGLASLIVQWVILLTLGALFLARRPLSSRPLGQLASLVVVLMVACGLVVGLLAWVLFKDVWPLVHDSAIDFFVRLTGITLTAALLTMAALQNHWRVKVLAIRTKQAELESLQARTHPHFLFNTLNTGAALVHARPEAAEALLLDLADLFRAALTGPRHIPLDEEVDLTRRYLSIEQLRLGARLSINWELPSPLPEVEVPALSLQPLVENAVRHGIEQLERGGTIDILVAADAGEVAITVRNDRPKGRVSTAGGYGLGLPSVRQRIEEMTQGRGELEISESADRHITTIRIPAA